MMIDKKIFEKKTVSNLLLIMLAGFAVTYFLIQSQKLYSLGFPLDDAWIHQVYARNLVRNGEWAFLSGFPSSGSTAPLWTILLTPGYFIKNFYYIWSIFIGFICLVFSGIFVLKIMRYLFPDQKGTAIFGGAMIVLEWHFIWAALSGMETILYVLILAVLFYLLLRIQNYSWVFAGILIGLAVWVRPDGITLFGPVLWMAWFVNTNSKTRFTAILKILISFSILITAYLLFNYFVSGSFWPNTMFAKQAEYAVLLKTSFFDRFLTLLKLPIVGAGGLLLPGFFYIVWKAVLKNKLFIRPGCYGGLDLI